MATGKKYRLCWKDEKGIIGRQQEGYSWTKEQAKELVTTGAKPGYTYWLEDENGNRVYNLN